MRAEYSFLKDRDSFSKAIRKKIQVYSLLRIRRERIEPNFGPKCFHARPKLKTAIQEGTFFFLKTLRRR